MSNVVSIDSAAAAVAPASNPMAVIQTAIASGASVETLERLMALQERWEANESRKAFDQAIAAAKAEIKPIVKNKSVDFTTARGRTNYDYEDLAGIADQVDPILTRHGLSYRFKSEQTGEAGSVKVTCIISHERGHREETSLSASRDETGNKNPIQAMGSSVTYLQRYTLKLALGLAATKDTDGASPDVMPKQIDGAQFRYLQDLIEKAGADESKLLVYLKADSLDHLSQAQYRDAEAALRKKIKQKDTANG